MSIIRKIKIILHRIYFKIIRYLNQRHCYDFPAENNGWKKFGDQPVLGNEITGTMFDPFVYMENNLLVMIVSERKTGNLVRLESSDGIKWKNQKTVLERIGGTWESIVNRASVVVHDGKWHMWYTGQDGTSSKIGYAISNDGIHYSRVQQQPVVSSIGGEGVSVMNPHVIWNKTKNVFQMWYAAGEDYEPDILCYAESEDGVNWSKRQKVLEKDPSHEWEKAKVGGCHVTIDNSGLYTMYYIGYQNVDVARICFAKSTNGIHWTRPKNNLLISPSRGAWDSDAVYKPTVVERNGKLLLWYNGRSALDEYIGLIYKS